jgi:thioredoxin 1
MNEAIILNGANFETEVLQSAIPVLVKFSAPWCSQCLMLTAVLKQVLPEFEGRVKLTEVDVDKESELREKNGIISIPALFLYKNGAIIGKVIGIFSKNQIVKLLNTATES